MASWTCSASTAYPVDADAEWSGLAAEASIFSAWGWPDNPEPAKAAKCFLAHDSSAPELKGSYKLPFAVVRSGKPVAIAAGIRAAASRLSSTDIPDDVKAKARSVIDAYEKKAGMGDDTKSAIPPKKKPRPVGDIEADGDNPSQDEPDDLGATDGSAYREELESRGYPVIYAARVALVRAPSLQPPDPEKLALDPDIFAQNPPFAFRAEISNDREDAYYTRMHPSSLKNYANDADDGVALQNSHRADELPLGHSYRGRFMKGESQPDQIARTHADFYVIPGLKLSDVSTDDLIKGIKSRVVRDMSVGFYGGMARCTICGNDVSDERACGHVPGLTYRIKRANGDEEEQKGAAWIHDARLAECSMVYDGATPGAAVIKAQRMAESGRLNPGQARFLETQFRVRLGTAARRYFPGFDPRRGTDTAITGDRRMGGLPREYDDRQGIPPAFDEGQGLPPGQEPSLADLIAQAGVESSGDLNTDLRSLLADYQRLKRAEAPPAEERARPPVTVSERELADARAYRAQITEEARAEGVRALGAEFEAEYELRRWAEMPVAAIAKERDRYAMIAQRLFPGGRHTVDKSPPPGANGAVPTIPDAAYAS